MKEVQIGDKFYKLQVINKDHVDESGEQWYRCKCNCGSEVIASSSSLRYGHRRTCGNKALHSHDRKVWYKDIAGKQFGKLTVIGKHDSHYVQVRCECGTVIYVPKSKLVAGLVTDCGCSKTVDLRGKKFNHWTVIDFCDARMSHRHWLCRCDCGTVREVNEYNLIHGISKSCGHYVRK